MNSIELDEMNVSQLDFAEQEEYMHRVSNKSQREVQRLSNPQKSGKHGSRLGLKLLFLLSVILVIIGGSLIFQYVNAPVRRKYKVQTQSYKKDILENQLNASIISANYLRLTESEQYFVFQINERNVTKQIYCRYNERQPKIDLNESNCHDLMIEVQSTQDDQLNNYSNIISDLRVSSNDEENEIFLVYSYSKKYEDQTQSPSNNSHTELMIAQLEASLASEIKSKGTLINKGPKNCRSGVILFGENTDYLFFGEGGIYYGEKTDESELLFDLRGTLLSPRINYFDSLVIKIGPQPKKLETGDYIFFYNSQGVSSDSGQQINGIGYVILDKDNITNILQRSDEPLIQEDISSDKTPQIHIYQNTDQIFLSSLQQLDSNNFYLYVIQKQSQLEVYRLNITY